MYELGFKDGDKVLAVNGKPVDNYYDIIKRVIVGEKATVERDGRNMDFDMPENLIGKLVEKKKSNTPLILPRIPAIVEEAPDSMAAFKAGMRHGDRVLAIDSVQTPFFDQVKRELDRRKGDTVLVQVARGDRQLGIIVPVSDEGKIGFLPVNTFEALDSLGILDLSVKKYGVLAAIPGGVRMAGSQLGYYIDQFKKILSPKTEAYKGVGGFKSMGSIFPASWDWESFWTITAFFSIVLAFMNLLPIPALDGGHVVFTLVEMVTGRKPNQKFLEYAQIVGMVLLLGLMVYANANDWLGWGRGR
jgi:regulator of sigma E protease